MSPFLPLRRSIRPSDIAIASTLRSASGQLLEVHERHMKQILPSWPVWQRGTDANKVFEIRN